MPRGQASIVSEQLLAARICQTCEQRANCADEAGLPSRKNLTDLRRSSAGRPSEILAVGPSVSQGARRLEAGSPGGMVKAMRPLPTLL